MVAWGSTAVQREPHSPARMGKAKELRKLRIPKFRSRTFKQPKGPKALYPKLEESTFKFYDFREDNAARAEDRKPYIVFLDEHRVGEACQKERKEYFKSISGLVLKIFVGVVVMAFILGCLWTITKLF